MRALSETDLFPVELHEDFILEIEQRIGERILHRSRWQRQFES
jgi:hypothetical protein